ncbi:hypothetical protein L596_023690 [Steinernema carpocapsae]|uniref:Uncharacterized protein n=1 Tax=Steinernema carpocapsae TaxID=34508 RepID=A0A4U5MEE8_STECR|nr:hypothetical protein L596_023690 [Steinernema carpocapsae]
MCSSKLFINVVIRKRRISRLEGPVPADSTPKLSTPAKKRYLQNRILSFCCPFSTNTAMICVFRSSKTWPLTSGL